MGEKIIKIMKFLIVLPLLVLSEQRFFTMRKSSTGKYGFTIQTKAKRRHFATEIVAGGQAEKVGLQDGWKIQSVNGGEIDGLLNEEVAELVTENDEVLLLMTDEY